MKILVTGGAGYIGGFMTRGLLDRGDEIVVLDSLERGHKESLDPRVKFYQGNLLNKSFVSRVFAENSFDAVINFAGFISMGESMQNPYIYFENNVMGSLNLIEEMVISKTDNFIFSSSAGIYGNPITLPIPEDHPKNPENPYGESKLMVEKILGWYEKSHNLHFAALRYFNASGAALDGSIGENHTPESHIIPNIIKSVLDNTSFKMFGKDYKTKDGTCVRDYIHVLDLVDAHMKAIDKLKESPKGYYYNVGTGNGYSNKEICEMVEKVSGKKVLIEDSPRRPGDADSLIADPTKINKELNFSPKYSDLETIVKTAWQWHSKT